jgi:predicted metal-dependent hydrolase
MDSSELRLGGEPLTVVEIRRSTRRRRTISAHREGDRTVVLLPFGMTRNEEDYWVDRMLSRLDARDRRHRKGDDELERHARELSRRYLNGEARPASVRWVTNMSKRWGSCTPADRTIRLSHRLQRVPSWVRDYVLVHELAHLLVIDHNAQFHALVAAYPHADKARGYLHGLIDAAGVAGFDDPVPGLDDDLDDVDDVAG